MHRTPPAMARKGGKLTEAVMIVWRYIKAFAMCLALGVCVGEKYLDSLASNLSAVKGFRVVVNHEMADDLVLLVSPRLFKKLKVKESV